jgi:hypothetical protein
MVGSAFFLDKLFLLDSFPDDDFGLVLVLWCKDDVPIAY